MRGFQRFLRLPLSTISRCANAVSYKRAYRKNDVTALRRESGLDRNSVERTETESASKQKRKSISTPIRFDSAQRERKRDHRMPASANRVRRAHDLIKFNMTRSLVTDRTRDHAETSPERRDVAPAAAPRNVRERVNSAPKMSRRASRLHAGIPLHRELIRESVFQRSYRFSKRKARGRGGAEPRERR